MKGNLTRHLNKREKTSVTHIITYFLNAYPLSDTRVQTLELRGALILLSQGSKNQNPGVERDAI